MNMPRQPWPERFDQVAGPLPEPGVVPAADASPYNTVQAVHQGFIDRDGVKIWYAVRGDSGPWIAFAPPLQIVHSQMLKGTVPYLSRHFRVVTVDGRSNGRSDRPMGQDAYSFDHFYADFVAALDAVGAERVALVGISAAAITVLRLAAEQPHRVTHVVTAGGFADSLPGDEKLAQRLKMESALLGRDWPAYIDWFMSTIFNEPHSICGRPFDGLCGDAGPRATGPARIGRDARTGALPTGGNRRRGASRTAHCAGAGQPLLGAMKAQTM